MELVWQLVALFVPFITGKVTEWVTQGIKTAVGFIDAAPAVAKQALALLVAAGLTWAATFLNAPQVVEGDPGVIVSAVIAWILSMVFYHSDKISGAIRK